METANTVTNVNVDRSRLKEIANSSHTAETAMILLALRERAKAYSNVSATKLQLVRMGEQVVESDYKKFWKDLEEAGVGSMVYGRRGNPDKFMWAYSLKNVGQAAIEGKDAEIKAFISKKGPNHTRKLLGHAPKKPQPKPPQPQKEERVVYTVPVRPGVTIEVALPKSISEKELLQAISQICSLAG